MTREEQLQKLYDRLPKVKCRGLCTEACGPLMFTQLEADVIKAKFGRSIGCDASMTCTALSEGRCTIYEARPYVCRAYGAVERLECPHGCKPEKGVMSDEQSEKLFHQIMALGGGIYSTVPDHLKQILGLP